MASKVKQDGAVKRLVELGESVIKQLKEFGCVAPPEEEMLDGLKKVTKDEWEPIRRIPKRELQLIQVDYSIFAMVQQLVDQYLEEGSEESVDLRGVENGLYIGILKAFQGWFQTMAMALIRNIYAPNEAGVSVVPMIDKEGRACWTRIEIGDAQISTENVLGVLQMLLGDRMQVLRIPKGVLADDGIPALPDINKKEKADPATAKGAISGGPAFFDFDGSLAKKLSRN